LTDGARTAQIRQQNLRAVVDWSYELLFEDERRLFERLSVFSGSFDLAAIEAVCANETLATWDVANLVIRLVDKSLLVATGHDRTARWTMLQTLADYGRERLATRGEALDVARKHAAWFGELAGQSYSAMLGGDERRWLGSVSLDLNNLRTALYWAVAEGDAELAHTIAGGLGWYWWLLGNADEGLRWTEIALACPGEPLVASRARTLTWAGFLTLIAGRPPSGAMADEAIATYESSNDPYGQAVASLQLVQVYQALGQMERVIHLARKARELFASLQEQHPMCRAVVVWCDGFLSLLSGDTADAEKAMREYVVHPDNNADFTKAITLIYLADLSEGREDYAAAAADLERAHTLGSELNMGGQEVAVLARLANLAALSGDRNRARALYDEAYAAARAIGYNTGLALSLDIVAARNLRFGHLEAASEAADRALSLHEEAGAAAGCARALIVLGGIAQRLGDPSGAAARYELALEQARVATDGGTAKAAVEGLAEAALLGGDAYRAARLLGASRRFEGIDITSDRVATTAGDGMVLARSGDDAEHRAQRIEQLLETELGTSAFRREFRKGQVAEIGELVTPRSG
jgi:tetratricopeptide (TPR) repeat protein